jgi:hypothetical protein
MVRVVKGKKPAGRRVYIVGHRIHHGFTGCVLTALGICLAVHDRKDYRRWLKDLVKELDGTK